MIGAGRVMVTTRLLALVRVILLKEMEMEFSSLWMAGLLSNVSTKIGLRVLSLHLMLSRVLPHAKHLLMRSGWRCLFQHDMYSGDF